MLTVEDEVSFAGEYGATLRGWFTRPADNSEPMAVVILQGALLTVERSLAPKAKLFAAHGYGVLRYDHRNLGESDGEPRQQVDPWQQTRDLRRAISYVENRPDVDGDRVGLWGISAGAGNVLFVAALDNRVKAVVAVAPPVSGFHTAMYARSQHANDEFAEALEQDRRLRWQGEPARTVPLFSTDPAALPLFPRRKALGMLGKIGALRKTYRNEITIGSFELLSEFEPGHYAARISVPVLLAAAEQDRICPAEYVQAFHDELAGPKELLWFEGGHAELVIESMTEVLAASTKHFEQALARQT